MTALLEKAFAKASHLPRADQEQLAEQLLEDLGDESKWGNNSTYLTKSARRYNLGISTVAKPTTNGRHPAKRYRKSKKQLAI